MVEAAIGEQEDVESFELYSRLQVGEECTSLTCKVLLVTIPLLISEA